MTEKMWSIFFELAVSFITKATQCPEYICLRNLKPGVLYVKFKIVIDELFNFTTLNSGLLVKN